MTNPFRRREVQATADFRRILALPTRAPTPTDAELVRELTDILRQRDGQMSLRPVQARGLYELMAHGGLFGPMGVGTGKTLVTLLAAIVAAAERPLLLLPASLIEKTKRERAQLMNDWRVSTGTQIMSYQFLGREEQAQELDRKRPDLIIADECHFLKNKRAAVTRRVARYMVENPETKFVALSGTVSKNSLRDFAHILRWCLGAEHSPIPQTEGELEEWADALDEKVQPLKRVRPGALVKLARPEDLSEDEVATSRKAFRRRLTSTPGVVSSLNAEGVDCSLYINRVMYKVNAATEENFGTLRKFVLPCGWELSEAVEVWRHAKELALGLHYTWDPHPPLEWLAARSAWAKYVREVLKRSRTLDTEKQVRTAVEEGHLDDDGALEAWRAIEPSFKINSKPVWHDDAALDLCAAWLKKNKGIVWTEHTFFGRELSRRTGVPYFGQDGLDKDKNFIEDAKGPIIASIAANGTGKNLQKKWSKNLITSCPSGGDRTEQLIGRTHRPGQEEDEVTVEVLVGCIEHVTAWQRVMSEARMAADMLGQPQKVHIADIDMPTEEEALTWSGNRWSKSVQREKGEDE